MTFWELCHCGKQPFASIKSATLLFAHLQQGGRPPIVAGVVPQKLHEVMTVCWHIDPIQRPTALQVIDMILDNVSALEVDSILDNVSALEVDSKRSANQVNKK